MTQARCQEALKILREQMQACLHDDKDQLEFTPTFDDLVYWSQVVSYGLGELRELGRIRSEIARPRHFVEHLYARAERVVHVVKGLRGSGTLADVLAAKEIWLGVTGNAPKGHFSRVDSSGLVCVTYPCPSFSELSLNTNLSGSLDGIDLSASGATAKQVEDGMTALSGIGLLVAGQHTVITGPAGSMNRLDAAEFYLRLR